ncbi:hypothetical protein NQ315_014674 [Exocentrus adspersus]|uniref:DNA 3'-5' helicase n=1 Tax=Exocentrus adspersus TaxID=1586481 RepID=A0AAV8VPT7_9CUCU|nr:hypothetical protein NQ315_014674 [Exocentrus adspersus]
MEDDETAEHVPTMHLPGGGQDQVFDTRQSSTYARGSGQILAWQDYRLLKRRLELLGELVLTLNEKIFQIIHKPPEKTECLDVLEKYLKHKYKDQSGIIYASTIKECEDLSEALNERGLRVKYYHAQLEPGIKKLIHERWLKNKYQAVVATIAFGMGIDKPDVRFVIHYSVPKSVEGLYQESGRAGRDGKNSDCILMFSLADFLRNVSMASSKNEEKNAKSILEYCLDQNRCRRAFIAEFFEDKWEQSECDKMCDHCRNPKEIFYYDITPAFKDMVQLIEAASEKEVKLTLNKLVTAWFQSGTKQLRISSLKKPKCTKQQADHIIGYLVFKGYLNIDKGYSMYTTLAYIQKGNVSAIDRVVMPYIFGLNYQKVSTETETVAEPLAKKSKS